MKVGDYTYVVERGDDDGILIIRREITSVGPSRVVVKGLGGMKTHRRLVGGFWSPAFHLTARAAIDAYLETLTQTIRSAHQALRTADMLVRACEVAKTIDVEGLDARVVPIPAGNAADKAWITRKRNALRRELAELDKEK